MANKTQLQINNTALSALTERVNAAKEMAAGLPDAGSGGGASIETFEITVKTKKTPMGTAPFLVTTIVSTNCDDSGLFTEIANDLVYMQGVQVAVGSFIYIKTSSSATKCTIADSGLELVEFNATTGAIIKVVSNTGFSGTNIQFS